MHRFDRWLVPVITLLCGTVAAGAQPNSYCEAFFDQMAPDTLYSAKCSEKAGCLEPVVDVGGKSALQAANGATSALQKGQSYNFIYKTPSGGLPNSLVVVQLKQLDAAARTGLSPPLQIRRYGMDFSCFRGLRNASRAAWPPEAVPDSSLREISYDKFDQFHRLGFTSSEEDRFFHDNLHLRYFNGQTCVSTLDPVRRAQFLFHDHDNFAGRIERFFISLGMAPDQANAAELDTIRKYGRLKLLVSNYRRGANPQGCVAFTTKAGGANSTRLDLVIRDIEQQVQAYPNYDTSRSWSFQLE